MNQSPTLKRTIRPTTPAEIPIDPVAKARVFWCLRRYSSLAYAKQAAELLRKFIGGFDAWARQAPASRTHFARRSLKTCYAALANLEEVPGLLLRDYKTRAYDAVDQAGFLRDLLGPGSDDGLQFAEFGFGFEERPSTGLFAWAERALKMTQRMAMTVAAEWAETRIFAEAPERFLPARFPPRVDPMPAPKGPVIDVDQDVPITGVWLPIDVPNACPNFLVEAKPAPKALVEAQRIDVGAWLGDDESPPAPARTMYVHERVPSRWQLVWEDPRYRTGIEPDESEFLDVETDFPKDPPVHPPLS